jgi:hypothetical protein
VTDTTMSRRVNTVIIFYMKSYSDKWKDSKVNASVYLGSDSTVAPVASVKLSGFHEKKTSEFFMEKLRFENPGSHNDVLLLLKMIGGQTFKVGGGAGILCPGLVLPS